MSLIERIKENRKNGTQGNFCLAHDGDMIHVVTPDGDPVCSMGRVVCEEQKADAWRFFTVPAMENALLAAEELAKASDECLPAGDGPMGQDTALRLAAALAAYRDATK